MIRTDPSHSLTPPAPVSPLPHSSVLVLQCFVCACNVAILSLLYNDVAPHDSPIGLFTLSLQRVVIVGEEKAIQVSPHLITIQLVQ